jgi:hypothetical protein
MSATKSKDNSGTNPKDPPGVTVTLHFTPSPRVPTTARFIDARAPPRRIPRHGPAWFASSSLDRRVRPHEAAAARVGHFAATGAMPAPGTASPRKRMKAGTCPKQVTDPAAAA